MSIYNILYWAAAVGCLSGRLMDEPLATTFDYIFKPMLMPLLAIILIAGGIKKWNKDHTLLIIALLFAFGGDMFLMLGREGLMLLLGLGSFLIMQILYIFLFLKDSTKPSFIRKNPLWIIPFAALGITFYILSVPALAKDVIMLFAVAVYAAALVTMTITALNRKNSVNENSFKFVFTGAVLFLISDFIIGINQFIIKDFPYASFAIMITYITGQYLIVKGFLKRNLETEKNSV